MNAMPLVVRFLIAVLMQLPALVLWLVGMHRAFGVAWVFGEQATAAEHLKLILDWKFIVLPVAAMSVGYLMFEFGGILRGNRRLGNSPAHMAKTAALHWFVQMAVLLAVFGGFACYYSAKRQTPGTITFGVICAVALGALISSFFLTAKWSRHSTSRSSGDDMEPGPVEP